MGTLAVPASGLVYLDANSVIYAVEKIEPYHSFLAPLWPAARTSQVKLVSSELTWLETLTKPIRDGSQALEMSFRRFLTAREMTLVPANLALWEDAARLRALGLKTPDALHAATALKKGCELFLTNDAIFRRISGLNVVVLSEAIGA